MGFHLYGMLAELEWGVLRSLDVPMAAELLGKLIGLAVAEGALPAGRLAELYGQCETAEYRRDFVAIALKFAKVLRALSRGLAHFKSGREKI